jgi:hypothetical protein
MGSDGERAGGRFARGCRCFAIEQDGQILSYGWLSSGREWIGELSLWITPAAGEAYIWNCFTVERYRRKGHYRSLLNGLIGLAGIRKLWIGSVDVPAEKADADAGFARVLRCEVSRYGPLRRLVVTAAPGADSEVVADARQRLRVRGGSHLSLSRARVH